MKNEPFHQLQELIKIEDDTIREKAVLAFWETLSTDEQEEIRAAVANVVERISDTFLAFGNVLGEIVTQAIETMQEWFYNNPEIQAYIEALSGNDVEG